MIKTIDNAGSLAVRPDSWLSLHGLADVSVTSEHPEHPIEDALLGRASTGWRASGPGLQRITLRFRVPLAIRRMQLRFEEAVRCRTQEFAVRWSSGGDDLDREFVRQQYTFAPPGTWLEAEDYEADLRRVDSLQLTIAPDLSDPTAVATLREWRISAHTEELPRSDEPGPDPSASRPFSTDGAQHWRAWQARGAAADRASARRMAGVLAVLSAAALVFLAVAVR